MYDTPAIIIMSQPNRCAKECCNAKPTQENKYCRKHQLCVFIDETEALGKRVCKNVIRGCKAQLDPEYEFVRCEPCRTREKERDDARKAKKLAENNGIEDLETRFCKTCEKTQPLDEFVGTKNKGLVKSCKTCRETWKRNDANRDKEHLNALAREAEKKPERIAVKKAWEAANPDKVEQKCKKYRAKRVAKDIDGYLQHNANVMKNWRDRNPEKMEEANRKRRESIEAHYKIYQRSARIKKLEFAFKEPEFIELVKQPCYYCGELAEKGFNGIDRTNQSVGYVHANCVSCCEMCNWMKGSLDSATFIKRTKHILSIHKRISTEDLHPECFPDSTCVSYASYRSRAEKKELNFEITHDDYKTLTNQDCYLCGKQTTETHTNGIDRLDNTRGYVLENCRACCRECNHMKKNYGLDELLGKMEQIQGVWLDKPLPVLPTQLHLIVENKNKMTKQELEKARKEKKERTLQKHLQYLENIPGASITK